MRAQDRTPDARDDWPTPQWLVEQLAAEFAPGGFDLDPCASAQNAKAGRFFTEDDDGLTQPWKGSVFCNPPYGRSVGTWMAKAAAEVAAGRAALVVALVPARPGTGWYDVAVKSCSLVRVWPGRMIWPRANFTSAVLVFGELTGRHGSQYQRCRSCKKIFWPARVPADTCSDRCRKALSRSRIKAVCVTSPPSAAVGRPLAGAL